ncbi:MAG: glutathione peroxidase [Candidatus Zixiibacteriota bacterium]
MRKFIILSLTASFFASAAFAGTPVAEVKNDAETETTMTQPTATDSKKIPFNTIDGSATDLSAFTGKVLLIVNVASECGYTPQYAGLESIYRKYKDQGFAVVGFPANNFGGQEPGSDKEIKEFCTSKFNVTFPMMSKVSVKGDDIHPLFKYFTIDSNIPGEIKWNFSKFLVDQNGNLIARWSSKVEPTDAEITGKIEDLLKANKVEKKS